MTKPPAMPELAPLTGDILLEDRTIYVLNKNGENVWWASVQPGFRDNGVRVSDDQCRAVAADLVRLAALQSAQPAEVSDEEIEEIARGKSNHIEFARAILALRPQAVPIGRDDLKVLMSAAGYVHATAQEKADFINGFRNAEAHFGITRRADGGEVA